MKPNNKRQQTINSPGWEGLDAMPNPNARIEPTELDKLYQQVFSTEQGQKLLDHLQKTYLDVRHGHQDMITHLAILEMVKTL